MYNIFVKLDKISFNSSYTEHIYFINKIKMVKSPIKALKD